MENSKQVASIILERFDDLLTQGLSYQESETARTEIIRWLEARIDADSTESAENQKQLIEVDIPGEIQEKYQNLDPGERFELAATAFDRWRIQNLSSLSFDRAQAFLEKGGDSQKMKAEADTDLQEIQSIEAKFTEAFPNIHQMTRTMTSESKLDCIYVIRGGTNATSRRLGHVIGRMNLSNR